MDLTWMAWTGKTATFFIVIFLLVLSLAIWEWRKPGGGPRLGILGVVTTRGDRLFVSLLGSAYIHMGWLAFLSWPLWLATILSVIAAGFVFRYV